MTRAVRQRPWVQPLRPMTHEVRHLLMIHGRSVSMVPPPEMVRGGAAHVLEGIGQIITEIDQFQRASSTIEVPTIEPDDQIEDVYFHLMEYVEAVRMDGDRLSRTLHIGRIRVMLDQQYQRARRLLLDSGTPLPHVIVSVELKERAGIRHDSIGVGVQPWSHRPWFWESRFWDGAYQREQADARARESTYWSTGLHVPRPALLDLQYELEQLRDWMRCTL